MRRVASCLGALLIASLLLSASASASPALNESLKQIFQSQAYEEKHFGPARWVDGGAAYTTVEPSIAFPNSEARDIVRYETATSKRTVLVSASQLIPSPNKKPLTLENYAWSQDNRRLLIAPIQKKCGAAIPVAIIGCSTSTAASCTRWAETQRNRR